ncbi:MAG: SH3 domain-containing protein [Lachnospiraceae bacterium]|nr:SH3 domain-containing protein [Lachnospiraceae bacterium]
MTKRKPKMFKLLSRFFVMVAAVAVLVIAAGCSDKKAEAETSSKQEETAPATSVTDVVDTTTPDIEIVTTESTVNEPETTTESIPEETTTAEPEPSPLDGYVLADVKLYLNVREEPSVSAKVVGKMYVGDKATILEEKDEWTYITSGNVTGYVSNEYIVTGKAAEEYIIDAGLYKAKSTVSGLRIRKEPNIDCEYYGAAYLGQTFKAVSEEDGWVKIRYNVAGNETGYAYLAAEYVELSCELGEAITIEEEQEKIRLAEEARKAAEKAARIRKALDSCEINPVPNRAPINLSDEDLYLLACLVYVESGIEPYEGQLAVANVVLNRYLQGYGDTLTEIIYAKNQFEPVGKGILDKRLELGPPQSCVKAAKEAAAGVNNIGDYCHFITTAIAEYDKYIEYTVINRHCFYKRVWY